MSYPKLAEVAKIESYFDDYAEDILNLLEGILSFVRDNNVYEFKTSVDGIVLSSIQGQKELSKPYPGSLYKLCRLKSLIRYSFTEGASTLCILDIFFNDNFPGEGVTFLTLCNDVLDIVDWLAKEYGYKVDEDNAKYLIKIFDAMSKEFDKLR